MANHNQIAGVEIVVPVDRPVSTIATDLNRTTNPALGLGDIFRPFAIEWAPAWFYSALAWLGQTYVDASNTQRSFSKYLAGANVDPYRQLGSTRLFVIQLMRGEFFFLSIAQDIDSEASLNTNIAKQYARTDEGILQMYKDLSARGIFSSVTHCYVPGNVDLAPSLQEQLAGKLVGYDPATGMRRILLGSAMAQVVPIGDFASVNNEQIYDPTPMIVPLATSLVYDITTNNAIGSKTFVLPVAYVVDQATPGQFAVSRFGATQSPPAGQQIPAFDYGQTAVFADGPGFDSNKSTALTLVGSNKVITGGNSFITTRFQNSTAFTSIAVKSSVVTGVSALTCSAMQPLAAFSNQQIAGFYRDNAWDKSLGIPILDYKASNSQFAIGMTANAINPQLVYDPASPSLSGGNLSNVLAKFAAATYVFSPDTLQEMIANAGDYAAAGEAAGLSVMSAALKFDMSSNPAGGITYQLSVPVTATIMTTPKRMGAVAPAGPIGGGSLAGRARAISTTTITTFTPVVSEIAARQPVSIISKIPVGLIQMPVGQGGNTPTATPTLPSTVQVELDAFIPAEALQGTGITNIPLSTAFFAQPLGEGAQFQSNTPGTILNLCDAQNGNYALPPIDLAIAAAGLNLRPGVQYVFCLKGTSLNVRGSDGASLSATPKLVSPDAQHTYVGAMIYESGQASVRLYPILTLSMPAPAVGNGIEQGESYSVRFIYGKAQSSIDILDSGQVAVATGLSIASPNPTDNSVPQVGDIYFGSFIGGEAKLTVWAVPVFIAIAPASVSSASFNGTMSLGTVSSGLPAYSLQIIDSSLFVFTNINVDTAAAGSASASNVFVAGVAINSTPDDLSSKAFAPTQFVLGLVRPVQVGLARKFVFVPETDSVLIAGKRYMLSIIELDTLTDDPTQRPYPPSFWPDSAYWQFANRHNPYVDIRYEGATQDARIAKAQADTGAIAKRMQQAQEPLQMYLDTQGMIVWPIMGFPFDTLNQNIDRDRMTTLVGEIVNLLATKFPKAPIAGQGVSASDQTVLPGASSRQNPYTYGFDFTSREAPTTVASASGAAATGKINGVVVENLTSVLAAGSTASSLDQARRLDSLQAQQVAANLAQVKLNGPQVSIVRQLDSASTDAATTGNLARETRKPQLVYGFSVYNALSGECYLIELVPTDLAVPDHLPNPTQNKTYDPYYVRVVFVQRLKAYNMSIIVPSIAYDQYGHLAAPNLNQPYTNVLAKTDDLSLGYMGAIHDQDNRFDNLNFVFFSTDDQASIGDSQTAVCTNIPYYSVAAPRIVTAVIRSATFACRRQNWNATCALMIPTTPQNTHLYLAFGGGDLVPMRLDNAFDVDKRLPSHMYNLTTTFTSRQYDTAQTISVGNVPFVIGAGSQTSIGQTPVPVFSSFAIDASGGATQVSMSNDKLLAFPSEIYVVGQASTTLTNVSNLNPSLTDTNGFFTPAGADNKLTTQFKAIPYNNLVYLVRAVSNCADLAKVGGLNCTSGLLIDTYVPASSGNLVLARGARFKRSGLQFFGESYTPTTMVDSLDTLDFASIAGKTFVAPTIFVPIPELDATRGFVADIANFLSQQFWTFIYPEVVAQKGQNVNGVNYAQDFNIDIEGKPILSLQKLHFVYDPIAVLFTPNDLTHKYSLQPKQQVLALTNGQIQEGICWRTDHLQEDGIAPQLVSAQQKLPTGWYMDRPNVIYSSHNRPVQTLLGETKGLSINSFRSVSGSVYNIEEASFSDAMTGDQTGIQLISTVSSVANMLVAVLFDYDNNDLGTLNTPDPVQTNKGIVFINGYLGANGYNFSSPDHFDVNDILPSQVPRLDFVANLLGNDVAFYNTDLSLPRQYWSLTYDALTASGLPNYIPSVPPSVADPTFNNRTRSLLLNFANEVRPDVIGVMDTYSSVVSVNVHLQNGVTGSVFVNKKADRDVASLGSSPPGAVTATLNGLPLKYDFFLFSRDHYNTLSKGSFQLIDQGYAMCLIDDGTGTGNKVAKYYIDADGNYNELYTYALCSSDNRVLETNTFTVKITLAAPANPSATPAIGETPNNVNPQDIVAQINKLSNLVYAVFGPASPGQPPAYIPIQAVGEGAQPPAVSIAPAPGGGGAGNVQASPISGAPGFNGYSLNVMGAARQPVMISQIYSGSNAYPIAGSTTTQPWDPKKNKVVQFYGSLSHGLDKQTNPPVTLMSGALTINNGVFGGNGQGAIIGSPFSRAFQGAAAIPSQAAGAIPAGATMKGDDSVFYTFNAIGNSIMDSTGKSGSAGGGQYFVDTTDPQNPIWVAISTPKFQLNGNSYVVNLSTTLPDGITSRYTLVVGGKSYPFDAGNTQVQVDRTRFTFNPIAAGVYTVSYVSLDSPTATVSPSPISLSQFSMAGGGLPAGGQVTTVDVFNNPANLNGIVLGVTGRTYSYDPVQGTVTITQGANSITVPVQTGVVFTSTSAYVYVIDIVSGNYTVNGSPMLPYSASTSGSPASYPLMTAPQMFTFGSNFYTFDVGSSGPYVSVTGNGHTLPINPYQFSLNGQVFIINTNVQPNTVTGGGSTVAMTTGNTQFVLDGVQYTITLKAGSLKGGTISGQFNVSQGNVVAIEDYIYLLDTMNGQIVGNGTTYPLTTSGYTYTITTASNSFTVTTKPNADTVTIGNVVYRIGDSSVVGDGIIYPILPYRTFVDEAASYVIGNDGVVSLPQALDVTAFGFTDGGQNFTVNQNAASDGTSYFLIPKPAANTPAKFTAGALTYNLRTDSGAITIGAGRAFLVNTGALNKNQLPFGTRTLFFGRDSDNAAFDGTHYFPIDNNQFTDTNTGKLYTISANTAVCDGNSYEIYSNLGQGPYFEVPNGPTYYVNVAVADFGQAQGDIYSVFPITNNSFTVLLVYTVTIAGATVSVNSSTFGAAKQVATLTAAGGSLTGGSFTDPVTGIVYTCVPQGQQVTFIDSNNVQYPLPLAGGNFTAQVPISTALTVAMDSQTPANVYLVQNNTFSVGSTNYTVNVPVAYQNVAGPFWPMVAGRFIVPQAAPLSSVSYLVNVDKTGKGKAIKGYVVSGDDQFSPDGKQVYIVNSVNVVKATNQAQLAGAAPNQTVTLNYNGNSLSYTLSATTATIKPTGLNYHSAKTQLSVTYPSEVVTYTVAATAVTDNRNSVATFPATVNGNQLTFTDTVSGATFSFDSTGNNPISVSFPYQSQFFIDTLTGITFYVDNTGNHVEAILYLPETTRYAFTPSDGNTYLIHYNDVQVMLPVIAGGNVNAGVATVGSDTFTIEIDTVDPIASAAPPVPVNPNSFEINGELYTISQTGADFTKWTVTGAGKAPNVFTSASTFKLSDPNITYTLHADQDGLLQTVTASFPILPSRNLISVADEIFVITYATVTAGSLRGQGQSAIPITKSSFNLTNPFDTTTAKFIFADANIYDAGSVVGQFTVNQIPTFAIDNTTFTLDTTSLVLTDNNGRPWPLIANPMMFSINGSNYLIDTNQLPHKIVGNNNRAPLATDVTVQAGVPIANSTFTLNGQIYAFVEDSQRNLLTITGTKSYMIAQPAMTFKLDSSLLFTLKLGAAAPNTYVGTTVPIGIVSSGSTTLNVYAGTTESGGADFFTYKNVLYTFVKSGATYVAVQKSYTVYASQPAGGQQQLAVFDMGGTTYIVTDGNTQGLGAATGINPGSMWSATATSLNPGEIQFGLVYGLASQPVSVLQGMDNGQTVFQFPATDSSGNALLFDIIYSKVPGTDAAPNQIIADVPKLLPNFTQAATFDFLPAYAPLTFETGGYNAFTTAVAESATPLESFSAAWKTPVVSFDDSIKKLITLHGDFSVEFWHSMPVTPVGSVPVFTYSGDNALISHASIEFPNTSLINVTLNKTVMQASTTPTAIASGWRHIALTYTQPYVMVCTGAPFVVANGSNFNFERDFTISMTISASSTGQVQGLLYKGTGSDVKPPATQKSFRVTLTENNEVQLDVENADGTTGSYTGPALVLGQFYQVLITKHTKTPMGADNDASSDPYTPPFDPSTMTATPQPPGSIDISKGSLSVSNEYNANAGSFESFAANINPSVSNTGYIITIAYRKMLADGHWENSWTTGVSPLISAKTDASLLVNSTGAASLVIGGAYDDQGNAISFGAPGAAGNIREVYLFASAFRTNGIRTGQGFVQVDDATYAELQGAGLVGCWKAAYDPNGTVFNKVDNASFAVSSNGANAILAPLPNREVEGIQLYVNGSPITLTLLSSNPSTPSGSNYLCFNAGGDYRIQEISFWNMARQAFQVLSDMFGQLIPSNEPFLTLYMPGSFSVASPGTDVPILPMAKYIDNIVVENQASLTIDLGSASLDLQGCPAIGRCGPLISPNFYTPPSVALTVCDTPPDLTTYSVTVNSITGTLAGVLNEAYVFVRNNVLTVYAGKKVGDLALVWVSQEQGDVQIIGYVEGAPPAPMANLTNKSSYAGATSVIFNAPFSLSYKYQTNDDGAASSKTSGGATGNYDPSSIKSPSSQTIETKYPQADKDNISEQVTNSYVDSDGSTVSVTTDRNTGALIDQKISSPPQGGGGNMSFQIEVGPVLAALGFGAKFDKMTVAVGVSAGLSVNGGSGTGTTSQQTASEKLDEGRKYTVRMEGAMAPYSGDTFMAGLNSLSVASTTVGTPASKIPILPNPNLGGFTTSNPPGPLPKTPVNDERFGQRMFMPSPYGQAFVSSRTLDVYQQILLQTNTTFGFLRVPDPKIPRDLNILSFRMSSKYIRPGVLDGMIGYQYNPASLASGAKTWQTSTGQLSPVYDSNFATGEVGHDASYMRLVEAYQLKKQIDQQALSAMALYQSTYNSLGGLPNNGLTPGLDFYNEYLWTARGGTQEVKHSYTTNYEEVMVTTQSSSWDVKLDLNAKVTAGGSQVLALQYGNEWQQSHTKKFTVTYSGNVQFDVTANFDGLENDTQMRYNANNDAHFVMNYNSTFNPANQSGLNLVIGSDGLVYNIVPSITSGAGLPTSDNSDATFSYQQPPPSYATGNASGLTGNLEPYDRPGKTKQFRSYAFYLQPKTQNAVDFWNTVIDSNWLNNSDDPDARALLSAKKANTSVPWRMLYRVTYSERFLPPIASASTIVPQIKPIFAVPVLNAPSDFLFQAPDSTDTSAFNPHNDVEANIVLVIPTASGLRIGKAPTSGSSMGIPALANNVIPFDIAKNPSSLINWGDSNNSKLLTALLLSITAQNIVPMTAFVTPGCSKVNDVLDPNGSIVYTVYVDPNGLTTNVPMTPGTIVYRDINGNPIQYSDGKTYYTLQADYIPSKDGSITYYIQPPSSYDQTVFSLTGDDDLYGSPGDMWRYYLVSGISSNLTASESVKGAGPFLNSAGYAGFKVAPTMHVATTGKPQVEGYVLVQGVMQWPNLNLPAETFADVQVYKSLSVLDTFPIGDPEILIAFLKAQYPDASFVGNDKTNVPDNPEIELVFAKNITTFFNSLQKALLPE